MVALHGYNFPNTDPSNGITITSGSHSAAADGEVTDWTDTDAFETLVGTLFTGETLVNAKDAAEHLAETLQEQNN